MDEFEKPNRIAKNNLGGFVKILRRKYNLMPNRVRASAMEGIMATYIIGDKTMMIESYNDDLVFGLLEHKDFGVLLFNDKITLKVGLDKLLNMFMENGRKPYTLSNKEINAFKDVISKALETIPSQLRKGLFTKKEKESSNSILIGDNITCTHNNCVVIGSDVVTTDDNQFWVGNKLVNLTKTLTSIEFNEIVDAILRISYMSPYKNRINKIQTLKGGKKNGV